MTDRAEPALAQAADAAGYGITDGKVQALAKEIKEFVDVLAAPKRVPPTTRTMWFEEFSWDRRPACPDSRFLS